MISSRTAKLISYLPQGLVNFIAEKILKGYLRKYAHLKVEGKEKLKNIKKPSIFVCNHLSNSDALVLKGVLKEIDPTFVAGIKLSQNVITNLAVGICKTTTIKPNTPDKEGLRKIVELIKSGESIVIFPEGTRSREKKMIEAKKGILLIAKLTKAPIVPIGIHGTEELFPINEEGNMSSERFYEADVFVKIGDQFELAKKQSDENKKDYEERAIKDIMYSIARLLPPEYQGIYSLKKD